MGVGTAGDAAVAVGGAGLACADGVEAAAREGGERGVEGDSGAGTATGTCAGAGGGRGGC